MRWAVMAVLLAWVSAGCDEDECTASCKLVAQCKEDKNKSPDKVLGEKRPPPDRRCVDRCKNNREAWAACESRGKSCEALRGCLGANFDD